MCTVLTVSADLYSRHLFRRIMADAYQNADGFSLVLVDDTGAHTLLRTMHIRAVTRALEKMPWTRLFLHCRYATQGEARLVNTHGWEQDGVIYMHNGMIYDKDAWSREVDSQQIGVWLRESGVVTTMERLMTEPYANVFLIDTNYDYYVVSRSKQGTLFTDWKGNYSTNRLGPIRHPVPEYTQNSYWYVDPDLKKQREEEEKAALLAAGDFMDLKEGL